MTNPKSESLDDLERHMEQRRLERAVIEAARALRRANGDPNAWADAAADVLDAVEALEEVEHD